MDSEKALPQLLDAMSSDDIPQTTPQQPVRRWYGTGMDFSVSITDAFDYQCGWNMSLHVDQRIQVAGRGASGGGYGSDLTRWAHWKPF